MNDVLRTISSELDASVHRAVHAGLERRQLVIDPGMGFGKRKEQNAKILADLRLLAQLELPVLVGPSRKHFLSKESTVETRVCDGRSRYRRNSGRRSPGACARCEGHEVRGGSR